MKRMIRFICIVLIISLCATGTAFANEYAIDSVETQDLALIEKEALAQADALQAYFVLRGTFTLNEKNGEIKAFPNMYGGCYINEDNQLIVLVTDIESDLAISYQKLLQSLPVEIRSCDISLNDALQQYRELTDIIRDDQYLELAFYSARNNSFIIQCNENAISNVQSALNIIKVKAEASGKKCAIMLDNSFIDSSMQELGLYGNREKRDTSSMRTQYSSSPLVGGSILYESINDGYIGFGTLGIAGTLGGVSGYNFLLTAGHVVEHSIGEGNTLNLYNGSTYTPLYEYYTNYSTPYSNGDYSILYTTSSNYYSTNLVYTNSNGTTAGITYYYNNSDYPEGAIIYKYGPITGLTYGTVYGISYDGYPYDYSTNYIGGCIVLRNVYSQLSQPGDSGGPCWALMPNGSKMLMGVVSGNRSTNDGYFMYVSPLYLATSMGFVPYNMTEVSYYGW